MFRRHACVISTLVNQYITCIVRLSVQCQSHDISITFDLPLLLYTVHEPSTTVVQSVRMPNHNMSRACPRKLFVNQPPTSPVRSFTRQSSPCPPRRRQLAHCRSGPIVPRRWWPEPSSAAQSIARFAMKAVAWPLAFVLETWSSSKRPMTPMIQGGWDP